MKPAILVVDDDIKTVDLIRLYLEKMATVSWWHMMDVKRLNLRVIGAQA